jgi:hypothetical protein
MVAFSVLWVLAGEVKARRGPQPTHQPIDSAIRIRRSSAPETCPPVAAVSFIGSRPSSPGPHAQTHRRSSAEPPQPREDRIPREPSSGRVRSRRSLRRRRRSPSSGGAGAVARDRCRHLPADPRDGEMRALTVMNEGFPAARFSCPAGGRSSGSTALVRHARLPPRARAGYSNIRTARPCLGSLPETLRDEVWVPSLSASPRSSPGSASPFWGNRALAPIDH